MNRRDYEVAIEREVEHWPGVVVQFVEGGKHPKARFTYSPTFGVPVMLARPFASTPSDAAFGVHQMLGDMRRTMRQLGAERNKPEPSKEEDEAPYRKPNDGAARREPPAHEQAEVRPSMADKMLVAAADGLDATAGKVAEAVFAAGVRLLDRVDAARASVDQAARVVALDATLADATDDEREAAIAELRAQVESIVDGIYFDLPENVYHAVPRLSASGLQRLCVSPATFWRGSWLDPERPDLDEEETKAQLLGKVYHCARLEPERFHLAFARKPHKSDYPAKGLLTSDTAVKAELKALGQQQTVANETTEQRAERLLDAGYEGTILPLELARFDAQLNGRTPIEAKFFDQITTDMERIKGSGEIAELLVGGAAEVSIFYTDQHGIKMKQRVDYLTPGWWVDFKTFDNSRGKELDQALADAVRYNRYHVQATTYRDGNEAVRTGGLQIQGEATDEQRRLIAAIQLRPNELQCHYVFQEKGGVPNLLARRFPFFGIDAYRDAEVNAFAVDDEAAARVRAGLEAPTQLHNRAKWEIDRAKRAFVHYSQVYAPGTPWFPIEPRGTFSDIEFSSYWLEGR